MRDSSIRVLRSPIASRELSLHRLIFQHPTVGLRSVYRPQLHYSQLYRQQLRLFFGQKVVRMYRVAIFEIRPEQDI